MGVFSMYSELAAAEGRFEGYVRPILEDPKFVSADETEGPFRKAWEGLVNLAAKILENKQEDQVATQIPLRGELTDPDVDLVTTIVNLLRNAFVAAFQPFARRLDQPARRRERRAVPLRRAAGRGAAGPRTIAPGTPARSLLTNAHEGLRG